MRSWKAGTTQITFGPKTKNLIDSLHKPVESIAEYIIDNMIENMLNYNIQMKGNMPEGTLISFISPQFPKIEVEYNTQIIGKEPNKFYPGITKSIYDIKCRYFYAQLLIGAGYQNVMIPNGYRLKCNDLNRFAINGIEIPADMAFRYEVDVLKIYISFKDMNYYGWPRFFGHLSQLDKGWTKEVQSIQLDSSVNYDLFPAVDLNYQHY